MLYRALKSANYSMKINMKRACIVWLSGNCNYLQENLILRTLTQITRTMKIFDELAHFQLKIQSVQALILTWFVINCPLIGWKLQKQPIRALDSDVTLIRALDSDVTNFSSLNDVISTNEIARFKDKGSRDYKRRYTLNFQLKVSLSSLKSWRNNLFLSGVSFQ